MINETRGRRELRRIWSPRTGLLVIVVGIALLTAACGGGSTTTRGQTTGSSGTTGSGASSGSSASTSGQSSYYQKAVAFAQCMRTHGVPSWPDPGTDGTFNLTDVPGIGHHGAPDSPQIQAAENACAYLAPAGSNASQQQQLQQILDQELKFAACMRSHGEPKFPDPVIINGAVSLQIAGLDHTSPQFQAAQQACQHLLPARAPSGAAGSSS